MQKITFESLYIANNDWDPDTILTIFLDTYVSQCRASTANAKYGECVVNWFTDTNVALVKKE